MFIKRLDYLESGRVYRVFGLLFFSKTKKRATFSKKENPERSNDLSGLKKMKNTKFRLHLFFPFKNSIHV